MLRRAFLRLLFPASLALMSHPAVVLAGDHGGDHDGGMGDGPGGDHDGGMGDGPGGDMDGNMGGGLGGPGGPSSGEDFSDDHEEAYARRRRGALRPLSDVLKALRKRYGGNVLDVRLRRRRGRVYYSVRIMDRRGRVRDVSVSAAPRPKVNFRSRR